MIKCFLFGLVVVAPLALPAGFAIGSFQELVNLDASQPYSAVKGDKIAATPKCPVIINGRCRSTGAPRGIM